MYRSVHSFVPALFLLCYKVICIYGTKECREEEDSFGYKEGRKKRVLPTTKESILGSSNMKGNEAINVNKSSS